MINEVLIAGIFFLSAILVQIIGTNINDQRNHYRNLKRIKEEIFFKKRLVLFEEMASIIERDMNFYFETKEFFKRKEYTERFLTFFKNGIKESCLSQDKMNNLLGKAVFLVPNLKASKLIRDLIVKRKLTGEIIEKEKEGLAAIL